MRDLAKDKAMCEAATPGTWSEFVVNLVNPDERYRSLVTEHRTYEIGNFEGFDISGYIQPYDAHFIVEARQALPYYIAQYEAAQARIAELDKYKSYVDTTNYNSEQVAIKSVYLEIEIEQLRIDNESLFQANKMLGAQNERFEADNAALLECVEYYESYGLVGPSGSGYDFDIGAEARECIAKLGGERDE